MKPETDGNILIAGYGVAWFGDPLCCSGCLLLLFDFELLDICDVRFVFCFRQKSCPSMSVFYPFMSDLCLASGRSHFTFTFDLKAVCFPEKLLAFFHPKPGML
jgi:hypothetical protein